MVHVKYCCGSNECESSVFYKMPLEVKAKVERFRNTLPNQSTNYTKGQITVDIN